MSRLLPLLLLLPLIAACGSPTPVADVDVAALVHQADDLSEPFRAGQVQLRRPDILGALPPETKAATVDYTTGADVVGVTSLLIYDSKEQAAAAYSAVAQSSEVADLGDKASIDTHSAALDGKSQRVIDLVVLRCRSVTHLRVLRDALTPDAAKEYARAIDGRVRGIGC
jgi:hypothetical protein